MALLSFTRSWLAYGRWYLVQETWTELQVQWPEPGDETVCCRVWAVVLACCVSEVSWLYMTP